MKVEEFYEYCCRMSALVASENDLSFKNDIDSLLQKQLAVGVASMFEVELCARVKDFVRVSSSENSELLSLVSKKAIERQYHSWFNWDGVNANSFFSLFGPGFKQYMSERVRQDEGLEASIRAFLELGKDRNTIVHDDFLNCSYGKTADEVFKQYEKALKFIQLFPDVLFEFASDGRKGAAGKRV